MKRAALVLAGLVLILVVIWAVVAARAPAMPSDNPLLTGQITHRTSDQIMVEENPAAQSGSAKCSLAVGTHTTVLNEQGGVVTNGSADDLVVGRKVSVWVRGPIRDSYPCQADADVVVIRL